MTLNPMCISIKPYSIICSTVDLSMHACILVTTILAIEKHLGSQHLHDNDYIISAVIEE